MFTALSQHSVFATLPNPDEMASRINFKITVNRLFPDFAASTNFGPQWLQTQTFCHHTLPMPKPPLNKGPLFHEGGMGPWWGIWFFWLYSGAHGVEVEQPMVNRS